MASISLLLTRSRCSYKSDIWSLGLVLMECATKTFPYKSARSYIEARPGLWSVQSDRVLTFSDGSK